MKKYLFLGVMAVLFALFSASCSLNNDILKPDCEVFEVELTNKWWQPTGSKTDERLRFASGKVESTETADSVTYVITNCNTIEVVNHTENAADQWTIEDLNLDRLVLRKDNNSVRYAPVN